MYRFVRKDVKGSIYLRDRRDKEHLINPRVLYKKTVITKNRGSTKLNSKFKLVTVRTVTNYTLDQIKDILESQDEQLREKALINGQPIPFKSKIPVTENDLKQVYGVYVDEDLYGNKTPVYLFFSANTKVKCFINATGNTKDSWSIFLSHMVSQETNPNGTKTSNWRIITIDSNLDLPTRVIYFLDSNQLPDCFRYNFDIATLNYLGGGTWTAMGVEIPDRIPVISPASTNDLDKYIFIGNTAPNRYQPAIVTYSFTPSYVFTWCRGNLELNYRTRSHSNTLENDRVNSGLEYLTKTYNYNLKINQRPALENINYDISKVDKQEYSFATCKYVTTTQGLINSAFQSPDYGTDYLRTVIQSYSQTSTVIRPKKFHSNLNSYSFSYQSPCYSPIVCASPRMTSFIRYELGEGIGSIDHGYEEKISSGSRKYSYFYPYKLWWVYGKIVGLAPKGDTKLYLSSKTEFTGTPIGSMFDLGELLISTTNGNAAVTTWDSPINPPSGFFRYRIGELKFIITYLNPPLFGHNSIYYFHINPLQVLASDEDDKHLAVLEGSGALGADYDNSLDQQKAMQLIYSQINAGLGGNGLGEFNIGIVNPSSGSGFTRLILNPSTYQIAEMKAEPERFPYRFWENSLK